MAKSKNKMTLVFTGSYVDGLFDADGDDIDIAEWAGLELDEDQQEQLWDNTSPIAIIQRCRGAIIDEQEHDSDVPGQSDLFIEVRTRDANALKLEVVQIIEAIIDES